MLDGAAEVNGQPLWSLSEEIVLATQIWALGQQVAKELEAIAKTPIGDIAERLRAYLIKSQANIVTIFQDQSRALGGDPAPARQSDSRDGSQNPRRSRDLRRSGSGRYNCSSD